MKKIDAKNITKQIICIIITLMLCSFIIPSASYATSNTTTSSDSDGGVIFAPVCKFITFLCDNVMQFMQNSFTSVESIDRGDGTYNFQYSPGVIFSGQVPALEVNFISPSGYEKYGGDYGQYLKNNIEDFLLDSNQIDQTQFENLKKSNNTYVVSGEIVIEGSTHYTAYYWTEDDTLHATCEWDLGWGMDWFDGTRYYYYYFTLPINDPEIQESFNSVKYASIAQDLQPTIATWYNALRKVALVGLLSVLVYVGIQILLTSAQGKENSKYKKMLVDWLIALCLLFTLHYIMSATLTIAQKISDLFSIDRTDTLMNLLRTEIAEAETWNAIVAEVIMYIVMTMFTVMFTFQYLKRVLYMGFFTLIAPLITLTYPLDKIKDSKAQAFSMWIKEFVFNALIQVVHLVVYFTLVSSAISLVERFPLYGILAIGFISQGEKIIRKMFGFSNATTIGTMEAMATGGLLTAALNKLQKAAPSGKKDSGGSEPSNNKVRTASNNALASLKGESGESEKTKADRWSGAASVLKRYAKPVGSATLGAGLGATGAMIGFATGVAQGDVSAALKGAAAGGAVGKGAGNKIANAIGRSKFAEE